MYHLLHLDAGQEVGKDGGIQDRARTAVGSYTAGGKCRWGMGIMSVLRMPQGKRTWSRIW